MADAEAAGTAAAEGQKKRKLSQLRPKTRKKLKQQQQASTQLPLEEKQRRQEQKKQRVSETVLQQTSGVPDRAASSPLAPSTANRIICLLSEQRHRYDQS